MKKCCLLISLAISFCADAQQQHAATLQQKALTLRRFLEKNHYQPLSWNDSASARLYDKWIGELDEEKLFFTQAEINQLAVFKTKLDEELQGRGWEFFTRSSTLFRLAILRADSLMQAILSKPLDFSKPDNIVWPCADYAANTTELALRWQRLFKWRILEDIADKLTGDGKTLPLQQPVDFGKWEKEMREKLKKREGQYIKGMLKTPASFIADREDEYLNSIAWCYDPHTAYMNLKEKKEFETDMSASEYSAGFDLEENEKGDKMIGYLQPGGSAWRSGQLHTGDQVVAVKTDGVEKKVEDMDDDDELERALGGSSQSDLELTVRTTAGETKTVKLTKEKITAEESIVKSYVLRGSRNIGYINLPGFYSRESESIRDERDIKYDGCANDVSKEIVKLKRDSIAGLILDLRYNGGGSMWEAMQLAGIFIDIGPVASVKDREGKLRFLKDPNRGTIYDGPLIVLVNGASASASEFVSAVLQDYNREVRLKWIQFPRFNPDTQVEVVSSNWYNPLMNYKYFMVPGILVLLLTMIGANLTAINIVREKEIGTIEQINVTPIRKAHFILGKLIPFWVLGMLVLTLGFVIARLAYGIIPVGSFLTIYAFAAIYLLAVLGLGLLISTYSSTQQQAMLVSFFLMMIFILLGGLYTSID
ncbi:MAG TPA: S41 family peptidase, partial [Ferruginibacter sp.]|nr:S41 family peptidase [Ferruginibacter sp.]